jgi:hypothetical protein
MILPLKTLKPSPLAPITLLHCCYFYQQQEQSIDLSADKLAVHRLREAAEKAA